MSNILQFPSIKRKTTQDVITGLLDEYGTDPSMMIIIRNNSIIIYSRESDNLSLVGSIDLIKEALERSVNS